MAAGGDKQAAGGARHSSQIEGRQAARERRSSRQAATGRRRAALKRRQAKRVDYLRERGEAAGDCDHLRERDGRRRGAVATIIELDRRMISYRRGEELRHAAELFNPAKTRNDAK